MKNPALFVWIGAALLLALIILTVTWFARPTGGLDTRPAHELVLLDASKLNLAQWSGKTVLVNFWATSCRVCLEEMPELIRLYREYRPRGLRVLGVAMPYDRPDFVTEMKTERPIPYPVALDPRGEAIRAFGNVRATPTTFVFAPDGQTVYHRVGRIDFGELEDVIRYHLPPNSDRDAS